MSNFMAGVGAGILILTCYIGVSMELKDGFHFNGGTFIYVKGINK